MSSSSDHVVDLLDDYFHDLLSPPDRDRVDGHCAHCDSCATALKQARHRFAVLRTVPPVEPSANLVQSTLDHITAERSGAAGSGSASSGAWSPPSPPRC